MENRWWPDQPVLEVRVEGNITNREQALALTQSMVDSIEASQYAHVIVILDLSALGQSPSTASLLGGNLPETNKIEHLILINAPFLVRMAGSAVPTLRGKLHFEGNTPGAQSKARALLPKLPTR